MSVLHEKRSIESKDGIQSVTEQETRRPVFTENGAQLVEDTRGDQTLHRDLKARQISMIAVSPSDHPLFSLQLSCDTYLLVSAARWGSRYRYCTSVMIFVMAIVLKDAVLSV